MARNLLNRYIWIIDTIHRHGRITRSELNELWKKSSYSNGEPETYKVQRKLVARDSLGYAIPGTNGEIQYLHTSGVNGRDVILQKLDYVRNWLKEFFNYNLDDVRMEVQRRQWLTDAQGNFVFDSDGRFINNLVYVREDSTTVLDELRQEVERFRKK